MARGPLGSVLAPGSGDGEALMQRALNDRNVCHSLDVRLATGPFACRQARR
jgi:hypothetical protein